MKLFERLILAVLLLGTLWSARAQIIEKPFFLSLPFTGMSPAGIPYCTVLIEDQNVIAKIDLGYEGSLSLPSSVLNKIHHKQALSPSSGYGLNGKIYPINVYKIKDIAIDHQRFSPLTVEEHHQELEQQMILDHKSTELSEAIGRIDWKLFHEHNLIINCKNHKLVLFDDIDTLKEKGYPTNHCTTIPFSLDNGFIEFEAHSDMGNVHCILDTGSTWNLYNQKGDQLYFEAKDVFDTSTFQIGSKDFGPITFNRISSPLSLQVIIGMEFFNDTLVIIDFKEKMLYFYEYET